MRVTTTKSKTDESFYINYAFINEKGKAPQESTRSSVNFLNFLKN